MSSDLVAIGRVVRPHGVQGELLLEPLTELPEPLATTETVYLALETGGTPVPHPLAASRVHRGQLLIRLADCLDRDQAEVYRGQQLLVQRVQLPPLPPGTYYQHQIVGLRVFTEQGEDLGRVVEILETGANDVYVVEGEQGQLLLPALRSVILKVDLEAGRLTVHLLEGLR